MVFSCTFAYNFLIYFMEQSFKELVRKNRSYRRFDASKPVGEDVLTDIIDTARMTPSGANRQTVRFRLVYTKNECEGVFNTLKWAAYLSDWAGPEEQERPTAYIVLLNDKSLTKASTYDDGIIAQTITLATVEKGLGCCILQACKSQDLLLLLGIDSEKYEFSSVIAIGTPVETVVLEDLRNGDVRYYRDEDQIHHVPKRTLDELILRLIR